MTVEVSSMDLLGLLQELKPLEGARMDKFYQKDDAVIMYAYKSGDGKYRLYMAPGKAFLTDYKREMPEQPPAFCMYLRKKLGGKVIERVEQYDFDRILEIHTDEEILFCELFRDGNFILTNKNREILHALRTGNILDRDIYKGETYEYPDSDRDPEAGKDVLDRFPEEDIVIVLASKLGLGGRYAEEICARADIDKNTAVEDLTTAERDRVMSTLKTVLRQLATGELAPHIYSDEDGPVAVTPLPFQTYADYDSEAFDSFSTALDTFYTEHEKAEYRRQQRKAYIEEKERLEHRLEQQERKLDGLQQAIAENKEKADLVYENYRIVEDVIDTIEAARQQYSDTEIEERLDGEKAKGIPEAEAIERLQLGNDSVILDLGTDVRIDLTESVEKNAEHYYEKSKQARNKIEGLETALQETRQRLENLQETDVDVESAFTNKAKKKAEKKWYEKFRWCRSSDGYLLIAGRDTTTNDMLVKKYLEPHDVYVHADFTGAPSVAIKTDGDEDVPDSTLREAGQFAVSFARAWQAGVTAEDAYWVEPDQVTQEPESGEYLPKGSFVIRGDRNYMRNLPVEAAIGAYERDGRMVPMGGPVDAVKANCEHYVVLKEGKEKPSDVAKKVQHHLHDMTGADLDLDRIIQALPPGNAAVNGRY